jgi:hypothetical protein
MTMDLSKLQILGHLEEEIAAPKFRATNDKK